MTIDPTTKCTCYPRGFTPDAYEGPQRHCAVHGEGPATEAVDRIPCGDPANCAAGGDCIDYADEVAEHLIERASTGCAAVDPTDAEVERLAEMLHNQNEAVLWQHMPETVRDQYRADARAVLADIDARWDRIPKGEHARVCRALNAHADTEEVGIEEQRTTQWGVQWEDELHGPGHTEETARKHRRINGVPGDMGQVVRRTCVEYKMPNGALTVVYGPWEVAP